MLFLIVKFKILEKNMKAMWDDVIVNVPIENEEWKKKLVKSMKALKYHDN